jgi:hypothetical protein
VKSSVNTRLTPRSLKKFVRPDKPLQIALLEAMKMELSEAVENGDFDSGKAVPLQGHELGYESWLRTYAPHAASSDLADHHHRAWNWAESLKQGTSPQALIECWFRGGGKSTTMELIVSRLAVKATRRFAVYVCATQDAADRHVSDIATAMERCGIERAINKYGFSRGWNASKLRTANGFNVLAFGLDTGARGVKLDHLRPDMIILDDIDELDDSVNGVEKKIKTITQTILPAKSTDCAVVFVQNRIHANSVMSHVLSGELDMLQDRIQSPIVPAIENLQYTAFEREDGRVGYKIESGTPTWSHKSLEVCQAEIDTYGLLAFLRECQHEVGVGGLFFPDFKEYDSTGKPWHVIDHVEVQPWWRIWGSHDFGTGAPACFLLYASDERENVYVIGEVYESGLVSSEQAKKVLQFLQTRGYGSPKDKSRENGQWHTKLEAVAFDWANTFPPMNAAERIGEYPVEVWWEMNIPAVRAVKDRKAGWRRVKEWVSATEYIEGNLRPKLQIVRGAAPNLIKQLSNTMANPRDPEDIDNGTKNDHAIDSFRYGVMWREYPVRCPETEEADRVGKKYVPTWMKNKRDGETKWI